MTPVCTLSPNYNHVYTIPPTYLYLRQVSNIRILVRSSDGSMGTASYVYYLAGSGYNPHIIVYNSLISGISHVYRDAWLGSLQSYHGYMW